MPDYNTQQKKLIMPEYGRNVQQMIDHCVSIEDREERTRCANTIINIMETCFPILGMLMILNINCGIIWLLCPILS